ncbi:MAG TPA: hypothetical protein VFN30_09030 [Chitinophagaceae bacterium]|nr:hypothetical protein [Chitinophagaceae bacterium]
MKKCLLTFFVIPAFVWAEAQTYVIDKSKFFEDTAVLKVTIVTSFNKMLNVKTKENAFFPAVFIFKLPDSTEVKETIVLSTRGNFRRNNCDIPPLRVDFNNVKSNVTSSLGTLKLVNSCRQGMEYNQYLLKEFLTYKIYSLLTDKSFRVRLINLTYHDSSGKKRDIVQNAFFIEDVKDIAKRYKMSEWKKDKISIELTDKRQSLLLAIFQYMIGNTDWSVLATHNIKLIYPKDSVMRRPFPIPYDFDYCGLVNAEYAIPSEFLNIENIRQRLYRGFPRSLGEIEAILEIFKQKKQEIYALINEFELLTKLNRKDVINYLDGFYDLIDDPKKVQSTFITNARTE